MTDARADEIATMVWFELETVLAQRNQYSRESIVMLYGRALAILDEIELEPEHIEPGAITALAVSRGLANFTYHPGEVFPPAWAPITKRIHRYLYHPPVSGR